MELVGKTVIHKTLGAGKITSFDGKHIGVLLEKAGEKTFQYPNAFDKFLRFEDSTAQEQAAKLIEEADAEKKAAYEAKKKEREEEEASRRAAQALGKGIRKPRNLEQGFGADYHVEYLRRHPILTYTQVEDRFGIRISGFGRGINPTATTIVLISSVDANKLSFVYHDHWDTNGDYIYSGEGKNGNQTMIGGNLAIRDAEESGRRLDLFVKLSPQEYYYQGIFKMINYAYENDKDQDGHARKEYKFRLRKVGG